MKDVGCGLGGLGPVGVFCEQFLPWVVLATGNCSVLLTDFALVGAKVHHLALHYM